MKKNNYKIGILGTGYIGFPLAVEFGKYYKTIAYDINKKKIINFKNFKDNTNNLSKKIIKSSKKLTFTNVLSDLSECNIFIIAVPTPVNKKNNPDMSMVNNATQSVANLLKINDIVIFESTLYPGACESLAVSILEKISKLRMNKDFYIGHSPERINPGDKNSNLTLVKKIVSGSNSYSLKLIDQLYKKIIKAGTYRAPNIKVAEAAKMIENTQRDINIALMNEFAIICNKLSISTRDVLEAASTKWNFLPFKPGLVGGHCIPVDPYYLTHISKKFNHNSDFILMGRKINDSIPRFMVKKIHKEMIIKKINIKRSRVLILGFSFKENCKDIRNTKVINLYHECKKITKNVDIYDSTINKMDVFKEYKVKLIRKIRYSYYDAIIIAVPHKEFKDIIKNLNSYRKKNSLTFDLKYQLNRSKVELSL